MIRHCEEHVLATWQSPLLVWRLLRRETSSSQRQESVTL